MLQKIIELIGLVLPHHEQIFSQNNQIIHFNFVMGGGMNLLFSSATYDSGLCWSDKTCFRNEQIKRESNYNPRLLFFRKDNGLIGWQDLELPLIQWLWVLRTAESTNILVPTWSILQGTRRIHVPGQARPGRRSLEAVGVCIDTMKASPAWMRELRVTPMVGVEDQKHGTFHCCLPWGCFWPPWHCYSVQCPQ